MEEIRGDLHPAVDTNRMKKKEKIRKESTTALMQRSHLLTVIG